MGSAPPPGADAESVLLREVATEATCLWLCGNYDACVQTLQKIETISAAKDPKVGRVGEVEKGWSTSHMLAVSLAAAAQLGACGVLLQPEEASG